MITIVLLLILAGITINLSLGQNGIFNRAKQAKENYTQSAAREKLETGVRIDIWTHFMRECIINYVH